MYKSSLSQKRKIATNICFKLTNKKIYILKNCNKRNLWQDVPHCRGHDGIINSCFNKKRKFFAHRRLIKFSEIWRNFFSRRSKVYLWMDFRLCLSWRRKCRRCEHRLPPMKTLQFPT